MYACVWVYFCICVRTYVCLCMCEFGYVRRPQLSRGNAFASKPTLCGNKKNSAVVTGFFNSEHKSSGRDLKLWISSVKIFRFLKKTPS